MPSIDLIVHRVSYTHRAGGAARRFADGDLPLAPPGAGVVRMRRLHCVVRVPLKPGGREAIVDTGAPVSVIPHSLWAVDFGWKPGRDFEELTVAGVGTRFPGVMLGKSYTFRFARVLGPVEISGTSRSGPRLMLRDLIVQLPDPGGPNVLLLGLWGNALGGCRRVVDWAAGSGDVAARLEF